MLQPDTIILAPGVRGGVKIQFVNAGPDAGSEHREGFPPAHPTSSP